ncbi:phage tail family protein [Tissierella creatinophila]|uniref:Phage tail protein n=1 Tax=Tissierella creatinophila DSM 6911 TaxID=1123403 RepID=A0A1U7M5T2_TISCR|nr:phage tail family protein [Tissierella creatinophila]OLS02548.1 phage tail protein [Tissierella creatinophila DSM 6911]
MSNIKITNTNGESITLGNEAPLFLERIDGVGRLGVELENQKSPDQDGITYVKNTFSSRDISIEGIIISRNNPDEILTLRRKMQRVLNPKLGQVTIRYKYKESTKEIKAIVESTPSFPSAGRGLFYQKYLINLICHSPFWLETYYESSEMSYIMGGLKFNLKLPSKFSSRGFKRKAVNSGDVDTPVKIEFIGPATNPTVTNETTGEIIKVNRELGEGDVLSICTSFGEKYVRINGENAFHYIDLDSSFWSLLPGENILSYKSNNDSINTRVKAIWRNRYIGF